MNAFSRLLAAAVLGLPAAAVLAQPHLRPGLWEQTVDVKSDDPRQNAAMAQMKERLAAMPPDQRAMIEKSMASHGIAMGAAPNSMRVCVTKEQAARGFTPQDDGHCTRRNVSTTGDVTQFDFACKMTNVDTSGHGTFTAMGDTAYTATAAVDTVTQQGQTHTDSKFAGRFISDDCGDVKRVAVPPAH